MKKGYSTISLALFILFSCVNISFCMNENTQENIEKKKKFTCKFCGKNFPSKGNLNKHERDNCKKNPNKTAYPCRYCKKVLGSQSGLNKHERDFCNENPNRVIKKYLCEHCSLVLGSKTTLNGHKKNSCKKNPNGVIKKYPCEHCSLVLSSNSALKRHKKNFCKKNPYSKKSKGVLGKRNRETREAASKAIDPRLTIDFLLNNDSDEPAEKRRKHKKLN